GDEGGGKGPFGKQISQQIRQPKGHQKGIEIFSRTEQTGENLLANQPKNTARQYRYADHASGARAQAFVLRRNHSASFHSPVGRLMNSQPSLNSLARCAASACTPKV